MTHRRLKPILAAIALLGLPAAAPSMAATFAVPHTFANIPDGAGPQGLVADLEGNLYGQTSNGGSCADCGVVFRIDCAGHYTVLKSFDGQSGGGEGLSQLTLKGDRLYGSTNIGGTSGQGTIFSIRTDGKHFTVLHSFIEPYGAYPTGLLAVDGHGVVYGTTQGGGAGSGNGGNYGGEATLFSVAPDGTFQILYQFDSSGIGSPGGVIFKDDMLFGASSISLYSYSISEAKMTTLVYLFDGPSAFPQVSDVDAAGNVYGYTDGIPSSGTLFELKKSGATYNFVTLATFSPTQGVLPSGLRLTPSGDLIGVTNIGPVSAGNAGYGTLFEYSNCVLTTLHVFNVLSRGRYLFGAPAMTPSGTIYGTAGTGGDPGCTVSGAGAGCGTVFSYTP